MVVVDEYKVLAVCLTSVVALAVYMALKKRSSSVTLGVGKNGQEMITLVHASGAVCEVYLHGATVTRYATASKHEVLWVSKGAVFDGKKGIRGGIPVVYPQFGPKADQVLGVPSMSQHGFARNSKWSVQLLDPVHCRVVLSLEGSNDKWPHAFRLELAVCLGAELKTSFKMINLADVPVAPQCLLHTYYATDQVTATEVHGLERLEYFDQLSGQTAQQRGPVSFQGETDRIYAASTNKLRITCKGQKASVEIKLDAAYVEEFGEAGAVPKPFAPDVVVWNPHIAKAASMSDFDNNGWTSMLCVEPGVLSKSRPAIAPANSVVLNQTITYVP